MFSEDYRSPSLKTRADGQHTKQQRWVLRLSITPPSWAGGYSNKTREGLLQIVANFLSNAPESGWTRIQEQLDYDLKN